MKSKTTKPKTRKALRCPSCSFKVTISERDGWRCPECTVAFCPFCQASIIDGCEHVLASEADDQGWNYSPFEGMDLPHLPEEMNEISFEDDDLREAFGKRAELVAEVWGRSSGEYCHEPDENESQHALFRAISDEMRASINSSSWEVVGWWFCSGGRDYFTLEKERALAEVRASIEQLRDGFRKLEEIGRKALDKEGVDGDRDVPGPASVAPRIPPAQRRTEIPSPSVRIAGRTFDQVFFDCPVGAEINYRVLGYTFADGPRIALIQENDVGRPKVIADVEPFCQASYGRPAHVVSCLYLSDSDDATLREWVAEYGKKPRTRRRKAGV